MPTTKNHDNGGHADDIFGAISYEAAKPQKKSFLPWHKPRKQYVREHQWGTEIYSLLDGMQPEGDVLRYLGLPGDDLLDLRYFHSKVCVPKQLGLRFLGFNISAHPESAAHAELNISLDEVKKLSGIDPLSDVIWDDFRLLSDDSSKAWHSAMNLGPYDVVNVDLCGGFAKQEPGAVDENYYSALSRLMSLQARKKGSWLLFLTTRTRKDIDVHADLMQRLLAKYKQNLIDCPGFQAASADILSIQDEASLNEVAATPEGHVAILLVGLCKWLLGITLSQQPPSNIEVKSVIGYRVYPQSPHDDLVSIALKFEPTFTPAVDPMGIANHPEVAFGECEQASEALRQVAQRSCADKILSENAELHEQLVGAMAELLQLARYDVDAYHKWLQPKQT